MFDVRLEHVAPGMAHGAGVTEPDQRQKDNLEIRNSGTEESGRPVSGPLPDFVSSKLLLHELILFFRALFLIETMRRLPLAANQPSAESMQMPMLGPGSTRRSSPSWN